MDVHKDFTKIMKKTSETFKKSFHNVGQLRTWNTRRTSSWQERGSMRLILRVT